MPKAKEPKLTPKQRAFIEAYAGNATEAAKAAGYSEKTAYSAGQRLLKGVEIQNAIREREEMEARERIATRQQRQEFWTNLMRDRKRKDFVRLKASELLGKSEADFIDKKQVDLTATVNVFDDATRKELLGLVGDE